MGFLPTTNSVARKYEEVDQSGELEYRPTEISELHAVPN